MNPQYAILIDGGFLTKVLQRRTGAYPDAAAVDAEVERIKSHAALASHDLLRIYFYDAPPSQARLPNPVSGQILDLSRTPRSAEATRLFDTLVLRPQFALRMGETMVHGWELGKSALRSMKQNPRVPTANDFVPNIEQKGVDLRIGLDIARLSLRGLVRTIIVVTGDSDLVPAFKFARREGILVYLDHLGHGIRQELKIHADLVLQ
jgi:uncharacterized LabA/DUF88 family protein